MRKEFSPGGIRKRDGRWVAYVSYQEETVDGEGNRVVRQRQVTITVLRHLSRSVQKPSNLINSIPPSADGKY